MDNLTESQRTLLREIRKALGDYIRSEGCSCCQNTEKHEKALARLGKLLRAKKFKDGSGYDFWSYSSNE